MSIEDPRLSSIDNTSAANDFDSAVEQHLGFVGEASEGIEVAQAETPDAGRTDRLPAQTPPAQTAAATIPTEVTPNAENVVTLPAGIELDNLEFQVDGDNLILVLADGTEIVVIGGAANIPTFVIGEVELPQVALFAALEGSDINVAAGPDGTFSAQSAPAASRNFQDDPIDAGPEDLALADLLGDTSFGDELRTALILGDEGDTEPTFGDAVSGAVDEDYLKNGNINDGAPTGSSSVTGSLNINWGSDDDNAAGNTGLTTSGDRGIAFTQDTLDALILRALTSDNAPLVYGLSENGTVLTAYKNNGEDGFGEPVFVVSVSDAGNGSYAFELLGNLDHPDGSTEDNIVIEFEFTAQDDEGDQASSSFTITVNDDSPVIKVPTGEDGEPLFGVVEEEQREVRGAGNEDTDGELDEDYISKAEQGEKRFSEGPLRGGQFVDETTNVAKGSLGISWGADDEDLDDKADFGTVASLGNRSVSFVIPETDASEGEGGGVVTAARSVSSGPTSGGFPLVYDYSADGKTLTAYRFYGESASTGDADKVSVKMLDNSPVFEVVLDDNGSGSYTFTLFGTLDHNGKGEDTLKLDFQFTATDSDGDVTGPATISIIVIDDVPVLHGCSLVFTVDEDDINTKLSTGTSPNDTDRWDDSYTGDPNLGNDRGPAYINGSLTSLVKAGADGLASFTFVNGAEATAELKTLADLGLSSHGDALRYRISGNELQAFVPDGEGSGERVVFSLTLQSSGSFEFKLFDQLDHDVPGDDQFWFKPDADQNFDLQDKLTGADVTDINFGALIKATDGDEDSISLDGSFSIKIRDDIPEIDVRSTDARLVIDETTGSDIFDNETSNPAVASLFSGVGLPGIDLDMAPQYAAQSGMVQVRIKEGADDDATVTWALKLSNGNGTYSGLQTTDGRAIYLFIENGLVVGRYDKPNDGDDDIRLPGQSDPDPAAFAIHIGADGTLSVVQYVSIAHDDRNDSDENNDADDGNRYTVEQTLAGKIAAVVTVKDFDGDKVSDSVEIGSRIVFEDDGPKIDVVAADDTEVVLETQDGETIGINVKDTAVSTAEFGGVFSIASKSFGADGKGSVWVDYALNLNGKSGLDSNLNHDGKDITLHMVNGVVYGTTATGNRPSEKSIVDAAVFSIRVDDSGKVTVTQFKEIDHDRSDSSNYASDLKSLADGLVKLTATATITDGDNDRATDSVTIDLGGNIKFADHGPTIATSTNPARLVVDEDGLPMAAPDSAAAIANGTAIAGSGSASTSVSVASLKSFFNFGADGAHATEAISLKAAINEPTGLTSQGKPILISVSSDGKTLTGTADGREVFTLKLNAEGTSYTFQLKDQIDHPTLNNVASGSDGAFNDAENLLSSGTPSSLLDLSQFIVGKDGDGDTVTLTAGKFVIDVRDDIPTASGSIGEVKIDTPQIVAPTEAKVANFVLVLDTSGSVNVQQFQIQVKNFLENLAATGAKDVRVHIVEFSGDADPVGTYDLIRNGVKDLGALDDALSDIAGLRSGGNTNYEAGMREALQWIEGIPARVLEVDDRTDDFDASVGGSRDEAYILFNGSTQVAMVSGWTSSDELGDAKGSLTYGWGVDGENLSGSERLRFDFGAFNDYDGAGEYSNTESFVGVPVTAAQFKLDDKNGNGSTTFSYTVHFTDGTSPVTGSQTVDGNGTLTITAPTGKLIAYIEFAATSGSGDVDLEKVTTAPDGPLANAHVNELIFLSDGEPNRNSTNNDNSASEALEQIKNEIAKIESGANAPGDQAFTIQTYGIKPSGNNLTNLGKVEGDDGVAENLTASNTLSGEYASTFAGLAGTPGSAVPTSANFNLSPLVNVGADEGLTFSLKSGASGPSGLQSGGQDLFYTLVNNTLTATAGQTGPTVFTLSLAANGSGTFTLNKPIDGQGDRDIDFSSLIQAQDFDGDAVSLAPGKFVVTVDGVPSGAPQTFETTEDESFSGNIAAIIGDDGIGTTGGFFITGQPVNGTVDIDRETGAFTYNPKPNWNGTETFSVTVKDDDGDVSAPIVVTVKVTSVNDAPVMQDASPTLTTIDENAVTNAGQLVSEILGASVSDVDTGAVEGIAITGTSNGNGTWQYSTNNGSTWTAFSNYSTSNALLLTAEAKVRFVPNGENGTTATLNYVAWDRTSGTAGSTANVTTRGGSTAFSTEVNAATITVTSVNDAPVMQDASPTLTTIDENAVTNAGQLVSEILGASVSDVDTGAVEGIAITGTSNGNGTWQYSTNNGSTWTAFSNYSTSNALLLTAEAKVRFVPNGENGTTATLNYVAWDRTSGTAGSTANVTTRGGSTAFSTEVNAATITVTSVNDAPVMQDASPTLTTIDENAVTNAGQFVSEILGASVSDVDTGAVEGIAITGTSNGNGTWQYSTNNGSTWTAFSNYSTSNALLLTAEAKVRFVPNGENGTTATLNYVAWDRTSGTAGSTANVTTRGGSTAFSTEVNAATITVTEVLDTKVKELSFTRSEKLDVTGEAKEFEVTLPSPAVGNVTLTLNADGDYNSNQETINISIWSKTSNSFISLGTYTSSQGSVLGGSGNDINWRLNVNLTTAQLNDAIVGGKVRIKLDNSDDVQGDNSSRDDYNDFYGFTLKANFTVPAADPIILDLDKNGFAFSSIDAGVTFDINADGHKDQIAWTKDDGILAYDVDGNGVIDNGSEIFTPDFNGGKFASGVAALASLDSNGDGKIDASDEAFSKLQIWVDADNDGVSDAGELSSLADHHVASISLSTDQSGGLEDGQTIFAEGEFTFDDGSTGNFLEVGFDTIFGADVSEGLTLHGGMGEVVMTGSAGADTFVFDGTALDELDVADVITDFSTEEGDVLDVTALLDSLLGEQASVDTAASHLRATVDDGNTTVSVQTAPDTWKDVVVLQNHDTAIKVLFDDKHATITPHD